MTEFEARTSLCWVVRPVAMEALGTRGAHGHDRLFLSSSDDVDVRCARTGPPMSAHPRGTFETYTFLCSCKRPSYSCAPLLVFHSSLSLSQVVFPVFLPPHSCTPRVATARTSCCSPRCRGIAGTVAGGSSEDTLCAPRTPALLSRVAGQLGSGSHAGSRPSRCACARRARACMYRGQQ